ncbi:MAG TPA: APC family permease [Gaiellaceae bacterium]|nr:APC family permease [Gaiellaceae bacterium]
MTTAPLAAEHAAQEGPLRRAISRKMLLFFILGDILGAGIYALVGVVAGEVGGAIWTAFGVALLLALLTAFAYAELVTKYPHAGGAALYVNKAFRQPFLTFMVVVAVAASGLTSAATLSRAFGGDYLGEFVSVPTTIAALVFLVVVSFINFRGISESIKINMALTFVEVTGLALIILIGIAALGTGDAEPSRAFEFKEGTFVGLAIFGGAALAFYALIGFEDSVNVAEEARDPARMYPLALFGGIILAGIIYFLVTFTASMVVPTQQLAGSDGPLLEVVREGPLGIPTRLFSAIALLAVANGALINLIMASRLTYGMANERILPRAFGFVHAGRRTPWFAIIFTAALCAILIVIGTLSELAQATVMLLLTVFTLVNISVLVLRRERVEHEHFVAPSVFPIAGAVVSIAMLIKLITQQESSLPFVIVVVLLAGGAALWWINRLVLGRTERIDPTKLPA